MKNFIALVLSMQFLGLSSLLAQSTQTLRGQVIDKNLRSPVIGANVIIKDSEPVKGTITDEKGYFKLENVEVGRVALTISFVGYVQQEMDNILVVSAKEAFVEVSLEESVNAMEEVVVKASSDKANLNNDMVLVSARGFNVEETMRFAGALNDPARMATSFAGVANTNDGRNDIIIRGNSPTGLLWRLEGLDVPNPNHYGTLGTTGGPVTILNNNQLANSDFLTAAFPAEYGNALSGVFDLKMRNGNTRKHQFLGQIGFNGLELGAEGPLSRKNNSSYMVNYRYSTLEFAEAVGLDFGTGAAVPKYQDLSYKFNFPTKSGILSLFGVTGTSYIELLGSEQDLENGNDLYGNETQDIYTGADMAVSGISYTHFFKNKSYLKVIGGYTYAADNTTIDSLLYEGSQTITGIERQQNIDYRQHKATTRLIYHMNLGRNDALQFGLMNDYYFLNIKHDYRIPDTPDFYSLRSSDDNTTFQNGYIQWKHNFGPRFSTNLGVYAQHFGLSESFAAEPRLSAAWTINDRNSITFGYGLHSQLQPMPVYFQDYIDENGNRRKTNTDLDFVRSHHAVLGYRFEITQDLYLKAEGYYQFIFNAAVDSLPSTFSMLNQGADFGIPDNNFLKNNGEGENFGLDITLEKYFSKSYYFMVSGSVFDSKYTGSDGVWRNTAFNGRYLFNVLAGKEWSVGRNNTLAVDWKLKMAGGRYYTPVDLEASAIDGTEVRDESRAFEARLNDYFRTDIKVSYRMNRPKVTHEFSFDVQNVTNRNNDFLPVYNRRTNEEVMITQIGLFPVPQYRIYF